MLSASLCPAAAKRLAAVAVIAGLLAGSLLGSGTPVAASHPHSALKDRYAVLIVLDGARPDYFNLTPMPNLDRLMAAGTTYSNAFVGQELADTPPGHATIGTGDFPKRNGVYGFLWQDPATRQMLDPTTTAAIQGNVLDDIMKASGARGIAARLKQADPNARLESASGHKCYASDAMGTAAADYTLCSLIYHDRWVAAAVRGHLPPPGAINNPKFDVPIPSPWSGFAAGTEQWYMGQEDAWTMRYALWAAKAAKFPRVLMINLPEIDVLGHFATSVQPLTYLMRQFDRLLGDLMTTYRRAGLLKKTDFVITADHGMGQINTIMPFAVINQAIDEAGATKVYVEHDTAAAIGLKQLGKARAVAFNISRIGGNLVDATYYKVHNHGRWTYVRAASQPVVTRRLNNAYLALANTMASASGPDVYAVFAPHVSTRYFVSHGYSWRQGHLGPQWDDQHIPLIFSGPGIRRGLASSYPARLIDIAPTVEKLLGLPTNGLDGRVLGDALAGSSRASKAQQQSRGRYLLSVVRLLEARSGESGVRTSRRG